MERALSKFGEKLWKLAITKALKAEWNLPSASTRRLPWILQASSLPWFEMLLYAAASSILQVGSPSAQDTRVHPPFSAPHSPRAALEAHHGLSGLCQSDGWRNHLTN